MRPQSPHVKRTLIALAEYYGQQLSEAQLVMYSEDLSDLSSEEVEEAAIFYRRNPKNIRFPLPAQLREAIRPSLDPKVAAADIAARITAAVIKRGYTWAMDGGYRPHETFEKALRADLGDVSVEVVRRSGGWKVLHDNYYEMDPGTFKAQLRGHIEAIMELSRQGRLSQRNFLRLPAESQNLIERTGGIKQILKIAGDKK
jgi:hypothetical protein